MPDESVRTNRYPESDEDFEAAAAELKARFAAWVDEKRPAVDREGAEAPLNYKWRLLDGHLTRWTRRDLSELYLRVYPEKMVTEGDEVDELLEDGKAFISFLADTGLLDAASEPAEVLVDHVDGIADRFRKHMADESCYSAGKRFAIAAKAEGIDLDDRRALNSFMERFNARSRAERDTVPRAQRRGRVTPPGTPPAHSSGRRRKRGR